MGSLIGIDMNGVRDALARCEGADAPDQPEIVDLGVHSGFIRLQSGDDEVWLGGAPTELAPHGRGPGWGRLGSAENRMDVLRVLEEIPKADSGDATRQAWTSALPRVVGDADLAVFAVPDTSACDETFRHRYLGLLKGVARLRPLLLWRPVAAILGWMGSTAGLSQDRPGRNAAILSLMVDGVHLSVLSLKEERHGGVRLVVPQRSGPGRTAGASFRGKVLVDEARKWLVRESGLPDKVLESGALSPWRFATGRKPVPELVRLPDNRGWRKLPQLDCSCPGPDERDVDEDFLEGLRTADVLLVEGPFADNRAWREGVLKAVNTRQPTRQPLPVVTLDHEAVARGCLAAAVRQRLGQPIYFDFLPQLQINAMVDQKPKFVDLIAHGQRCRGGESFRASAPGDYFIDKGAEELALWLFKEGFERGRKARPRLPAVADRSYRLSVSVEQVPGQGFAEVCISSLEFDRLRRSPVTLDWTDMEETEQTREEILSELAEQCRTALAWPDTAVKPGNPSAWWSGHPGGDLVVLLAAYRTAPLLSDGIDKNVWQKLKALRQRFVQPGALPFPKPILPSAFHALRSDGRLPEPMDACHVPEDAGTELDETLGKLERDLAVLQHRFGQGIDREVLGDILGFASWCFWRCPVRIADVLLGTYGGTYSYSIHSSLLCHGVARVVSTTDQLRRYFKALEWRLACKPAMTTADYGGLARVLGTSKEAARILGQALADRIVEKTASTIQDENDKKIGHAYKARFKTALRMLAALLRHRQGRPDFLDPDDPAAGRLLGVLDKAKQRVGLAVTTAPPGAARRLRANAVIIGELKEFIHLKGGNPNLIMHIDALDE